MFSSFSIKIIFEFCFNSLCYSSYYHVLRNLFENLQDFAQNWELGNFSKSIHAFIGVLVTLIFVYWTWELYTRRFASWRFNFWKNRGEFHNFGMAPAKARGARANNVFPLIFSFSWISKSNFWIIFFNSLQRYDEALIINDIISLQFLQVKQL